MKKWLSYAAVMYLALAALGVFTFMPPDATHFEDPADTSAILTAVTYPAERLAAIGAAKDRPFSALRHSSLRAGTPVSAFAAGAGILCTAVRLITKDAVHNIKNTILLKLRI